MNRMDQTQQQGCGKVLLLYGTVKAVSKNGLERILHPGDIVMVGEEIITGPDGMVSIVMNDPDHTRLDLGRSSTVVLDADVLGTTDIQDNIAEIQDIQQALQDNNFDPTQTLEAPAAGEGGAGAGGGSHPYVVFPESDLEVLPDAGAETTGITRSFTEQIDPDMPFTAEETINFDVTEAVALTASGEDTTQTPSGIGSNPPPVPPPPVDLQPQAGEFKGSLAEADLPDGTAAIAGGLDDLGIIPGDGVQIISFGDGQSIALDGSGDSVTINGQYGTLEFHDDGTWRFSLDGNADHPNAGATGENDQVEELFDYTVTDGDGDTVGGSMTFAILDDGPVAINDQAEATEGGTTISGNVITGNAGAGTDIVGADNPGAITAFTYTDENGQQQTATIPDNGQVTVTTMYGTLVMNSDGAYHYTPNPVDDKAQGHDNPLENITYTLADSDGDTSTANLTITVDQVPDAGNFQGTLDEDDLTNGTDTDKEPTTISGDLEDLSIVTGNGEHTISFADGQSIALDGSGDSVTINGQHGTLEFHDDGTWRFSLEENADHPNAGATGADDQVEELFDYTIADVDGDTAGGTMTFAILDDGPVQTGEQVHAVVEEEALDNNLSTGNQELDDDNDPTTPNATDGPDTATAQGSLASLVNPGADEWADTNSAHFSFTSQDTALETLANYNLSSHGDALTYSIQHNGANETLVAEATNNLGDTRTVFTLQLSQNGNYTFNLQDQLDHDNPQTQGEDTLDIDFAPIVNAVDSDGDQLTLGDDSGQGQPSSFTISVVDDTPEVTAPTATQFFYRTETAGYDNIVGVYELDENGAPVNPHIIVNSTDTLRMHPDDELVFTSNSGEHKLFLIANGARQLGTDIDNDSLSFVQQADGSYRLAVEGQGVYGEDFAQNYGTFFMDPDFNEDGLDHFAEISEDRSLGHRPTGHLGPGEETITDLPDDSDGNIHYIGIEDLIGGGDRDYDDATLFIRQGFGVRESALADGSMPSEEGRTLSGNFLEDGNIRVGADEDITLTVDGQSITLNGTDAPLVVHSQNSAGEDLGELTINSDGSWRYELLNNTTVHNDTSTRDDDGTREFADSVQDVFNIEVRDYDGDAVQMPLAIDIYDDGPQVASDLDSAVEGGEQISGNVLTGEKNSAPAAGLGADSLGADNGRLTSFYYTDEDGHRARAVVPDNDSTTVDTMHGTLTMSSDGTYAYTPDAVDDQAAGNTNPSDQITYIVEDGDGDSASGNFTIQVDQVPDAGNFQGTLDEDDLANGTDPTQEPTSITGDLHDLSIIKGDGEQTISFADGQSIALDGSGDSIRVASQHGTLEFHDDGTWRFSLETNADHADSQATGEEDQVEDLFNYSITDADGDSAGGTMTFAILDDGPVAVDDSDTVVEGESVTGNVITGEKSGIADPDLGPDQVGADAPGRISAFTYTDENGDQQTVTVPDNGSVQVSTEHGELTMHADGTYEYTADAFTNLETGTLEFDQRTIPDGVEVHAWDFGSTYVNNAGQFDPTTSDDDGDITMTSSGMGVDGGRVSSQIGYDPSNNTSEALSVSFTEGPVTSAEVTLSRLFPNEGGPPSYDERGKWEAFDENGNKVGEGVIGGDQTSHIVTGTVDPGQAFSHLIFTALPYPGQGNYTGDSSDYYLNQIDYTRILDSPQEQITYVLADSDGDTTEATLTIDVADSAPTAGDATQHSILDIEDNNTVTGSIDIDYGADHAAGNGLTISGYQTDDNGFAIDDHGEQLLQTVDGSRILYQDDGNGGLIALKEGTNEQVFTVQLDPTNTTYTVNYTSQLPSDANHPLTYDLTATDGDGSTVGTQVHVSFDDHDGNITGTNLNEVISGSSGDDNIPVEVMMWFMEGMETTILTVGREMTRLMVVMVMTH